MGLDCKEWGFSVVRLNDKIIKGLIDLLVGKVASPSFCRLNFKGDLTSILNSSLD